MSEREFIFLLIGINLGFVFYFIIQNTIGFFKFFNMFCGKEP